MWYLAGNKNKCDGHAEHAGSCQESWSKVSGFLLLFLELSMNGFIHLWYRRAGFCFHLLQRCVYAHPQTESSWANFNPIGMFGHCSKPIDLHFHCSNKLVVSLDLLQLVHDACGLALPQSNSYEISKVLFHCNMIKGFSINNQMWKIVGYFKKKLNQLDFIMKQGDLLVHLPFGSNPKNSTDT